MITLTTAQRDFLIQYAHSYRVAYSAELPHRVEVGDLLHNVALHTFEDRPLADRFFDAVETTDRDPSALLDDILGIDRVHVGMLDPEDPVTGFAPHPVKVFSDLNDAYEWVRDYDGPGTAWTEVVELICPPSRHNHEES